MKKLSLLYSFLFISLINGCVKKAPNNSTPEIVESRVTTTQPSRVVHTPTPPILTGDYQQLQTVQGGLVTLQKRKNGFLFPQYNNRIIILQIFGQECSHCFKEMPIINKVQKNHSKDIQVIALQAQDKMSKETTSRLIRQFNIDYPIVDKDEAMDLLLFIQNTYGWRGILPYILIIKNGVTEYSFSGEVSHKELNEAVESLI